MWFLTERLSCAAESGVGLPQELHCRSAATQPTHLSVSSEESFSWTLQLFTVLSNETLRLPIDYLYILKSLYQKIELVSIAMALDTHHNATSSPSTFTQTYSFGSEYLARLIVVRAGYKNTYTEYTCGIQRR